MKGRRYLVISYFWAPRLLLRSRATGDEETDRQRQTERERETGPRPIISPVRVTGEEEEGERKRQPLLLLNCPSFPTHPLTSSFPCHTSASSSCFPLNSLCQSPPSPHPAAFQAKAEVNATWRQVHTPPPHPSQEQKTGCVSWTMVEVWRKLKFVSVQNEWRLVSEASLTRSTCAL